MNNSDLIQALENLGFSNYEARAYVAILAEHPITGYKLSKISGVPRSRVYETIEKLTAKNLIVSQKGDITLVAPVDPAFFLGEKEKENQRTIDFLRKFLPQMKKSTEDPGIWNIAGRDQILEIISRLISHSEKHIYLLGFSSDLLLYEEALAKAIRRKVQIHGVYCGEKPLQVDHIYRHQGQPCSACHEIALSLDSKQALVGTTFPLEKASAALTKNAGIIYIIEQYIKHEIFISKMFQNHDESTMEKWKQIYRQIVHNLP
ncbi:MAG: TrmB family transcriptional regulator [Deltaproteobacteria bacterium]|nr:TrmB family transcriptional regulator [Deltaproteobacteria bacterium]